MASVKLHLYKHKTLKDGSHPILIQVLKDRQRKTFSTGYSAKPDQWNIAQNIPSKKHPNHKLLAQNLKRKVVEIEDSILELENSGKSYNLDDVSKKVKKDNNNESLNDYVQKLTDRFVKQGKLGNARVYKFTKDTFLKYHSEPDVQLKEIDYSKVKGFEDYLLENGNKLNSVSVHLRTLRAIINRAIKDEIIEETSYPFKKISIKSQKTRKRAVNKDVIKMVEELDVPQEENLQLWKDLFMFSFYNRGMNFVDMAFLKVKNIEGGRINYTRQKTGQQFSIKITDKAMAIIDRYNDLSDPESYIFPIIYRKGNEYLDYRNAMRLMNKKLKKISEILNLDVPLTTYVSRHSWATIAKRSGIATAVISEGLGHESEETTQVYLDSFENDVLDDANELIIS
jgi:integrase